MTPLPSPPPSSSSSYFVPTQFPSSSSYLMDHENATSSSSPSSLVLDDRSHIYTNLCKILKEYAFVVVYLFTGHQNTSGPSSSSKYYKKYKTLHTEFLNYKHFTDPRRESWYVNGGSGTTGGSTGGSTAGSTNSNIKNLYQLRISPNLSYFHFNYLVILCISFLVYISYFNYQPLLFCIILFGFIYFAIVYRLIFPRPQYQTLTFSVNSKISWSIIQHLTWIYNKVKVSVLPRTTTTTTTTSTTTSSSRSSDSTDQSSLYKSITLTRQQYILLGYCTCTLSVLLFTGGVINLVGHVLINTLIVFTLFILPHAIMYNPVYHATQQDQAV